MSDPGSNVVELTNTKAKPRGVINAAEIYDVTLLVPGLLWSGCFDRQHDPELAAVIDHVVMFLKNRR